MFAWLKTLISPPEVPVYHAPEAMRIYAVGDIHGCLAPLKALIARIDEDAAHVPAGTHIRIVFLGDYIDRGDASKAVVDALLDLTARYDCVFLKGNHEHAFLQFLQDPAANLDWLDWGGRATLASYGVDGKLLLSAMTDWYAVAKTVRETMPTAHQAFYNGLSLIHREGDYAFAHAGVRPGRALDQQDPMDLMTIRSEFLTHTETFGAFIVHGHTPVDTVAVQPHRLNLDSGAFYGGRLTAGVIEGDSIRILCSDGV